MRWRTRAGPTGCARNVERKVGSALGYSQAKADDLDWVESDHVYVIFKPEGGLARTHFAEDALRPLLRQAVVAIAAAVESFVARRACDFIRDALSNDPLPKRLEGMSVSFGEVITNDRKRKRRDWGYRSILTTHIEREASASPSKIGEIFSTVGVPKLWAAVNKQRHRRPGTSEKQLDELAARRNRIAHNGDWADRGRARLTLAQVEAFYTNAKEIVEPMDTVLDKPVGPK